MYALKAMAGPRWMFRLPKPATGVLTCRLATLSEPFISKGSALETSITTPGPLATMAIADLHPQPRLAFHKLPCVLMRAGTSKGLFIHRKDLPEKQSEWAPHLISSLGSRGGDPRQVDGVGGGTSTTSKVAVVSPSTRPGIDVDFTFAQVAVGRESVDFSGNCGNMCSGVGPFAVQEELVRPVPGQKQVTTYS